MRVITETPMTVSSPLRFCGDLSVFRACHGIFQISKHMYLRDLSFNGSRFCIR